MSFNCLSCYVVILFNHFCVGFRAATLQYLSSIVSILIHMLIATAMEVHRTRRFHLWTSVDEVGIINMKRTDHWVQDSVNGIWRVKEGNLLAAWILKMEAWQVGWVIQAFLLDIYERKIFQIRNII